MCDPMTMMMIAGGVQAGGKIFEGLAGSASSKIAAGFADANADILDTQGQTRRIAADTDLIRGNYDEFLTRRKVGQVLAAETVQTVKSGADPTYGSPLVVQGFSAAQGETEAQLIRARTAATFADDLSGVASIYGQAAGQRFKASSERQNARTKLIAGYIGAGTSMLSAGSKWQSLGGKGGGSGFGADIGSNPFMLQQPTDI